MSLTGKVVLITGGTGSFGRKFIELALQSCRPKKLIVFSRDELKQHEMRREFPEGGDSPLRYFIGDVRDHDRLHRACHGVDVVVHAAALKQVPACEYNPFEAIKTNVMGAENIIDAAIDSGVSEGDGPQHRQGRQPGEPLRRHQAVRREALRARQRLRRGARPTRFSCARYGNVVGSRGSVVPLFLRAAASGVLTVTDRG